MQRTVFSTPLITPLLRALANLCLKLSGWKVCAQSVPQPPFVIIATPHTSNWDFPLMLMFALHLKLDIRWMGKHTLFPPVFSHVMKWLGGIPIDRSKANRVVKQTVQNFKEHPELVVLIPPEGTRKRAARWKSGFYHIAHQAKVPILMAAIDAKKKQLHYLGEFKPSGDSEKELPEIKQYLKGFEGLIKENAWDYEE